MSEELMDAEATSRKRKYTATDHLEHLLRLGYDVDSIIIKTFLADNDLDIQIARNIYSQLHKNK